MGKTFSFVAGTVIGAAAGAIIGILVAPRSGAETRAMAADMANALATGETRPNLTLVFDIDPEEAARRTTERQADRMEAKGLAFQRRVAEGFRAIAREEPGRVHLVDASPSIDTVFACALAEVCRAGIEVPAAAARVALDELGRR